MVTPTTEIELVRLAIELARLRGEKNPEKFLDEAAKLLTEARFALGREQTRPEREAKERSEQAIQKLAKIFSDELVPFEKLCRPAIENEKIGASALPITEHFEFDSQNGLIKFGWRVYRDEREFKALLKKHAERIYGEAGKKLNAIQNESHWGEAALNSLDGYWLSKDWCKKFLAEKSSNTKEAVVREYVKEATQAFFDKLWQEAKANHIGIVTLFSIFQTRQNTYKNRGRKRV